MSRRHSYSKDTGPSVLVPSSYAGELNGTHTLRSRRSSLSGAVENFADHFTGAYASDVRKSWCDDAATLEKSSISSPGLRPRPLYKGLSGGYAAINEANTRLLGKTMSLPTGIPMKQDKWRFMSEEQAGGAQVVRTNTKGLPREVKALAPMQQQQKKNDWSYLFTLRRDGE